MSDNANKMGTDMAAIQNAYQGFANAGDGAGRGRVCGRGDAAEGCTRITDKTQKKRAATIRLQRANLSPFGYQIFTFC